MLRAGVQRQRLPSRSEQEEKRPDQGEGASMKRSLQRPGRKNGVSSHNSKLMAGATVYKHRADQEAALTKAS